MSFWNKVNDELKKAAHEGWSSLKGGAKNAAVKGEGFAKTGKLRLRGHTLHKEAERIFADLGGVIYEMARSPFENPFSNSEVMRLVSEIRRIEDEADSVERDIKKARKRPVAKPKTLTKKAATKKNTQKKIKTPANKKPAAKKVKKKTIKKAAAKKKSPAKKSSTKKSAAKKKIAKKPVAKKSSAKKAAPKKKAVKKTVLKKKTKKKA